MPYASADARQRLLDTLAEAIDELAFALAALGEAYEQLDDTNAERLEDGVFRSVQLAFGRARRTHSEFAARHGLTAHTPAAASAGLPSAGAAGFVDQAVAAVSEANSAIGELQDADQTLEVGDAELRAGLATVREQLDGVAQQARELTRTLGR